jgi:hypothetical protein
MPGARGAAAAKPTRGETGPLAAASARSPGRDFPVFEVAGLVHRAEQGSVEPQNAADMGVLLACTPGFAARLELHFIAGELVAAVYHAWMQNTFLD